MKGLKCFTSKKWWNAAGTRAIRSFAGGLLVCIPGTFALSEVDLIALIEGIGGAVLLGIVSLLNAVSGLPEVENEYKPGH